MTKVDVSTKLDGSTQLWRYMSLDKLIDLLSTSELYFSPLASFMKSDPFEGYLPSVAFEADASIFRSSIADNEAMLQQLEAHRKSLGFELSIDERNVLQGKIDALKKTPRVYRAAISKAITVNCWHINEGESEAMWRLYGDNGKAIAVQTTLDALRESIQVCDSEYRVQIYPVKYLDFFDKSLTPRDCVIEGQRAPFFKRKSYEHEREVRAAIFHVSQSAGAVTKLESWKPAPLRIPIQLKDLIQAIYISPYAGEPFPASVTRVCDKFGFSTDVVKTSRLLSGHEELLDTLLL